jgi:nitroimidazol reductase NimA-like FMN-containing flavoprotein (pyridoxamine 5'-phosphate oxidase superfamily)
VTITHVDGLVLAKSVFNHSVNYRSAVLFGRGRLVEDDAGKMAALAAFTEKILPGRWADARLPNLNEMKATSVIAVDIASASAKVRTGPPHDDDEDLDLPVWVGVLPLTQVAGAPVPAGYGPVVDLPRYLTDEGSV